MHRIIFKISRQVKAVRKVNDKHYAPFMNFVFMPLVLAASILFSASAYSAPGNSTSVTSPPKSSTPARADEATPTVSFTQLNDAEFVKNVTQSLMTQIELSKTIVELKANDAAGVSQSENNPAGEKVREYAVWILKDYEPALQRLQTLANGTHLEVPNALDAAHKRILESLEQKGIQQRDNSYLAMIKDQHDAMIDICNHAHDQSTITVEFRDFSDKILPTLQQNQRRAEKLLQMAPTLSNTTHQPIIIR